MSFPEASVILSSYERINQIGKDNEENAMELKTVTNEELTQASGENQLFLLSKSKTESGEKQNDIDEASKCGLGACKPKWSHRLANLHVFVVTYGIAGIWMTTLSSLLGSQVTSIERHFGLSSSRTGIILSSNDIGYLVTVLIGSHLGKYSHIPRTLSLSGIIFGLATVTISFGKLVPPRLWTSVSGSTDSNNITENYLCNIDFSAASNTLLNLTTSTTGGDSALPRDSSDQSQSFATPWGLWLLIICCLIGGMVKSYRIPLLTHYVERNTVDKSSTGFLLGISFTAMLFGPAIALFLGSAMNSLPVDLQETSITKEDQRWIGAWWLGFIIIGLCCVVFSLPIMFFPREMAAMQESGTPARRTDNETGKRSTLRKMLFDLPKSTWRIFRNPVFVLALVSACIEGFAFSGYFAFSQKYIEVQFNKTAQEVSITSGALVLVSLASGTFLGGFVTTKLKLGLRGCAILTLVSGLVTMLMDTLYFVFGCSNSDIVGITSISNSSNGACGCSDDIFLVCGGNNVNYRSPCLAGCTSSTGTMFTNCSEISNAIARPGLCSLNCPFFIPYMAIYFIGAIIGTASIIPTFMLIIRAVQHRDVSLANGMVSFCQTLLGMLPSPIVFGRLVDSTCTLWHPRGGFCMLYDRDSFRNSFQGLSIGLRAVNVVVVMAMLCFIHKRGGNAEPDPEQTREGTRPRLMANSGN